MSHSRIKKLVTGVLMVPLIALACNEASANPIVNPGFETGDGTGWNLVANAGSGSASNTITSAQARSGTFSNLLESDTKGRAKSITTNLGGDQTTGVVLSFWIRFTDITANNQPLATLNKSSATPMRLTWITSNGNMALEYGGIGSGTTFVDFSSSLAVDQWINVVVQFEDTTEGGNVSKATVTVGSNTITSFAATTQTFNEVFFGDFSTANGSESSFYLDDVSFTPIPEPASLALLGLGGALIGLRRRKAN